jgi:hypothetical protein
MAAWRLGEEIGHGALGRVVEVHDVAGQTPPLAGKILHESNRDDPRARERFGREAELLRELEHPNLVRVHGLETIDGLEVLLMERIEGPSLARLLAEQGKLPEGRLVAIARGIASGLAAAHRAGLVHRDLKPANVLIAAGDTAKIVDFGLARATSFAGVDKKSFALVGTPDYMAPESIDPLAVDPRSDLYSLGCMLHEMATGHPPYAGATPFALLEAHLHAPIPEIEVGPHRSAGVAELTRALLCKSPADRPQSAAGVEARLGALGALEPARAAEPTGACAECGAPLVDGVAVCFACGRAQLAIELGPMTVFVTGPGKITHKLEGGLRLRLVDWLKRSRALGLDASSLEKETPRLPFVLVQGVSERAAERLAAAVRGLGLEAATARGGAFALPAMREKAKKLIGRTLVVMLGTAVGGINAMSSHLVPFLVGLTTLPLIGVGVGLRMSKRAAARPARAAGPALPPALATRIARVVDVVPSIEAARHREGLRAVVQRLFALRASLPEAERARLEDDLGQVLDLATLAALRLDELERRLQAADLRETDEETRRWLRERDAWAARLLDATAQLDALRARAASAAARGAKALADEALDELRAQVAAFEEIAEGT